MRRDSTFRLWVRPPMWGLHALAVVAAVICFVGGSWQFGAYDQRQENERADRQEVPTVPVAEVWTPGDPFLDTMNHRPVTVTGTFAPADEQHWVSGRVTDGTDGYWLLTPLLLDGADDTALLVVRGFSPEAGELPEPPTGEQSMRVVLEPGEPADPGDTTSGADAVVIAAVRVPSLVNELPYALFPGFGISTSTEVAGGLALADVPQPEVSWTVGMRNLAYSMQWWVFGLFALFMWWRMGRDVVANERARRERGSAPADDAEPVRSDPVDSLTS
ncbi:SURF1 family protein [Aeromicrobium sp. Leaf350]|uniref:SURF1 family protein n=1 Tax=Aeromicrobium sp. Leaf350 TaxID=2876565 RepID=UPI001E4DF424|nr:SURF1 family protein [Aeromicrobium sp. Leaf350]